MDKNRWNIAWFGEFSMFMTSIWGSSNVDSTIIPISDEMSWISINLKLYQQVFFPWALSTLNIGLEMILFFYEFRFRENYQFKQEAKYSLGSIDEVSNFEQHLVGPFEDRSAFEYEKVDLITKNTFDK